MDVKSTLTGKSEGPCTWCKKTNKKGVQHVTYLSGAILGSHKLCAKCKAIIEDNGLQLPESTATPTANNVAPQPATK